MPLRLTETELLAILKFSADQQEAERVKKTLDGVAGKLKETEKAADASRKKFVQMREQAEKLQQVGTMLGVAGAATLAPLLLASRTYLNSLSEGEKASSRYITAQERLKDVQIRIGRETTEVLAPLMEKGADLAEKFADLIEKNPDLLKGILAMGGGLAAAGTITTLIAQVQRLISNISLLKGGTIAGTAATAGGIGLAASSAVIPGVGLGLAGYQGLTQTEWGQKQGLADLGQYATVISYYLGKLVGKENEWAYSIGTLTGAIEKADDTTRKTVASSPFDSVTNSQMKAYLSYQKSITQLDTQYLERRSTIIRNFNQQQAQELADFNRSQSRSMRDFYTSERQAEQDYYRNRLDIARSYNIETQRAEEDHQVEMRRLREDYNERAEDLIAQRDALGLIRETRAYEKDRRRADEDYQKEAARRNEDFAQQMSDLAEQFAIARAERLANFQQQMKDAKENFQIQRQREQAEYRQQLQDLETEYNKERKERREAFIEQLQDLAEGLTQERILRSKFTAAMLNDLKNAITEATNTNKEKITNRDSGGYMYPGVYRNASGKREFVLASNTVEAVERMAQRSLNQETILALMSRGGGSAFLQGSGITYIDQRRMDSRLTSEDRRSIQQDTLEIIGGLLHA